MSAKEAIERESKSHGHKSQLTKQIESGGVGKFSPIKINTSRSNNDKNVTKNEDNDKNGNKSESKNESKEDSKVNRRKVFHHHHGISPSSNNREQPRIHNKLYCETVKRKVSETVLSKLSNEDLRSVKSHTQLAETANGVRMLAKNLSKATIQLDVRAIMIVTKARDNSLIYLTREVVEWLLTRQRDITVYVDKSLAKSKRFNVNDLYDTYPKAKDLLKFWDKKLASKNPEKFDLVLTLGGDGTVLYVSNLYQRVVPPVISFALGSLGFLTNFKFEQFRQRMTTVLDAGVKAYLRMRFTCRVHKADGTLVCEQQVLNELVIDRGPSPYVTQLELYGDGSLLTVAQADGLIIATPTGSTAYSLSAGGSLVHPGVSAISVTPICPHTLSFRPILLPDGMYLKVKVPETSRATAWSSFDGKVRTELCKGDYVTVQASQFPFPTVISSKTEYFDSVSRNLNWNARETQKPFNLLSDSNKKRYSNNHTDDFENLHIDTNDEREFDIDWSSDGSSTPSDSEGDPEVTYESSPIACSNPDDRTCYAHPMAKISLDSEHSTPGTTPVTSRNPSYSSISDVLEL